MTFSAFLVCTACPTCPVGPADRTGVASEDVTGVGALRRTRVRELQKMELITNQDPDPEIKCQYFTIFPEILSSQWPELSKNGGCAKLSSRICQE